jgi:VNT family MFS transporter (synaptic vesicle glycoprotein 2)
MQRLLWSPLLVAAALLAAGSIAIMLLPETAHRPLEDTVEDAQDSEVTLTVLAVSAAARGGDSRANSRGRLARAQQQAQQQQDQEQQGLLSDPGEGGSSPRQRNQHQAGDVELGRGSSCP